MTNRPSETWLDTDKQTKPMPGEVDLKEAYQKALMFAAIERRRTGPTTSAIAVKDGNGKKPALR